MIDPPVLLASMTGLTDRPFRALVGRFGAGPVVSGMLARRQLLAHSPSALARAEIAAGSDADADGAAPLARAA